MISLTIIFILGWQYTKTNVLVLPRVPNTKTFLRFSLPNGNSCCVSFHFRVPALRDLFYLSGIREHSISLYYPYVIHSLHHPTAEHKLLVRYRTPFCLGFLEIPQLFPRQLLLRMLSLLPLRTSVEAVQFTLSFSFTLTTLWHLTSNFFLVLSAFVYSSACRPFTHLSIQSMDWAYQNESKCKVRNGHEWNVSA